MKEKLQQTACVWYGFFFEFWVGFFLPFHMVNVACHTDPSNGINFAVIHQAVVSTPGDCHAGHEVPVIQQGHVTPDVGQRDARLHPAWNPGGKGEKRGEKSEIPKRQQLHTRQSKPDTTKKKKPLQMTFD